MALGGAFKQDGLTFSLSAGAAVTSTPVRLFSDLGIRQMPQAIRLLNNGTIDVWVEFDSQAQAGTNFPVAGTANAIGTPAKGVRLKPGIIEVFYFQGQSPAGGLGALGEPGFVVNMIAASAGPAIIDFTLGEGL
jgi:hypothetical protein